MGRYNHFLKRKYERVLFSSLAIGDKFRQDFWTNGRWRRDIICEKTGLLCFTEKRNKKQHNILNDQGYEVSSLD